MKIKDCEELALWAGLKQCQTHYHFEQTVKVMDWELSDGSRILDQFGRKGFCPAYFSDMNAGIRDLVPKLNEKQSLVEITFNFDNINYVVCKIVRHYHSMSTALTHEATGNTIPESLANACLKLVRAEMEKSECLNFLTQRKKE